MRHNTKVLDLEKGSDCTTFRELNVIPVFKKSKDQLCWRPLLFFLNYFWHVQFQGYNTVFCSLADVANVAANVATNHT